MAVALGSSVNMKSLRGMMMNRRKFLQLPGVALLAWAASKVKLAPEEPMPTWHEIKTIRVPNHLIPTIRFGEDDEFEPHGGMHEYGVEAEFPATIVTKNNSGQVWKSDDGGNNWHEITTGFPNAKVEFVSEGPGSFNWTDDGRPHFKYATEYDDDA